MMISDDEIFEMIEKTKLKKGEQYILIPMKWYETWCDYKDSIAKLTSKTSSKDSKVANKSETFEEKLTLTKELSVGGERPPPIDNSCLLAASGVEMRKDFTYDQDYTAIPEKAYQALVKLYGSESPDNMTLLRREVIERPSGKAGRTLSIEVYPLVFDLYKSDLAGKAELISAEDRQDVSSGMYRRVLYSRNEKNCKKLLEIAAQQFQVGKSRIRLWARPTSTGREDEAEEWRLVDIKSDPQTTCGAEDICEVLVEEKNANGKWPRDTSNLDNNWRSLLKVGDRLDAQDEYSKWREAEIVKVDPSLGRVLCHYRGWAKRWDEWIDVEKDRDRLQPKYSKVGNWRNFRVNDRVEGKKGYVRSPSGEVIEEGKWTAARVVEVDRDPATNGGKRVKLHWDKSDASTDEWYDFDSDCLQRYGTHIKLNRSFNNYSGFSSYSGGRSGAGGMRAHTLGSPAESGAVGLRNLGNTCFMNSILQCLSNCEPLTTFFLSDTYKDCINLDNKIGFGGRMTEAYGDLIKAMWSGDYSVCVPSDFKKRIGEYNSSFAGYQQQDCQELMTFLLDGLHEDCNLIKKKPYVETIESDGRPDSVIAQLAWEGHLKRNKSFVTDHFFGQLRSHIKCNKCDRESITFDPYMTVNLPLPIPTTRPIELLVVFKDPNKVPLRCQPCVPIKGATVGDLKKATAAMANIEGGAASLLCAEMSVNLGKMRIEKVRQDHEQCTRIRARETTFMYEVEIDQPQPYEEDEEGKEGSARRAAQEAGQLVKGLKVRCRWNHMNGNEFNGWIDKVNGDGTFEILYSDGDYNSNVPPERFKPCNWEKKSENSKGLGELGSNKTVLGIGRVAMEVQQKKPSPKTSTFRLTSSGTGTQWEDFGRPLVLVFPRQCTGREMYRIVWEHMQHYVKVGSGYNEQRFPYDLALESKSSSSYGYSLSFNRSSQQKQTIEVVNNDDPVTSWKEKKVVLKWSLGGFNDSFDESSFAAEEKHKSIPRRGGSSSGGLDLNACFQAYAEEEQLDEQNEWYCNKCKKHVRAFKQLGLWSVPDVFIVGLKRFHYSKGWRKHSVRREKITSLVHFPVEGLDVSDYVISGSGDDYIYDLFAVSNHSGGLGGGHYTAYAKNFRNGKWYDFNDSSCQEICSGDDPAEVARIVITPRAYQLFYKRRGTW
eukprot:g2743.t1